jgi:tetratricopeptide (TPR) repeat protein
MKSGLWILVVVLIAAVAVGMLLRPRLARMSADEEADLSAELDEIMEIEDSETKISALQAFIVEHPESELKATAYYRIGREILDKLDDQERFDQFAQQTLAAEVDTESKAVVYYLMYRTAKDSGVEDAAGVGRQLLADLVDTGWIYNHIGYDLADQGEELELALSLCSMAVELAESGRDSASHLDSRGWVYYKMGRYPEAIADLEAAVAIQDEPDEEVLKHLAYATLKGGRSDKAFDTFRSILVMGEYDFARSKLDSLMKVKGYTPEQIDAFENSIWQDRIEGAELAQGFRLPAVTGGEYEFTSPGSEITVINFFSPT